MDVKTFATLLSRELVSRGIPKELAVKHAVSLVRTFDEEDLREISSYTSASEFEDLSDSLCDLIKNKELSGKRAVTTPAVPNPTIEFPDDDVRVATGAFPRVTKDQPAVPDSATKEIPVMPPRGQASALDGATKEIPVIPPKGQTTVSDAATREIPVVHAVPTDATIEMPAVTGHAPVTVPDGATREIPVVPAVPDGATREIPVVPAVPDGATREIPVVGAASSDSMKTREFRIDPDPSDDATRSFPMIKTSDISLHTDSDMTVVNIPIPHNEPEEEPQEIYLDEETEEEKPEKTVLTKRGKAFFWGIAVATSPVTILISLLVLSVFALGIVAVCAFIVMTLLLVCAEAVLGSGLTLVGIIYGAIEIISGNPGIGIYEIGLGICCGGLALCLGILTYNLAVLGLPYILKQLLTFEGYCLKRVGPMLERFREECNRL